MYRSVLWVVVAGVVIGGAIALQVYLSKKDIKWLGLILPGCMFILSVVSVLGIVLNAIVEIGGAWAIIGMAIMTFLLLNIPTAVLLAICFACRSDRKKQRQMDLEKMNLQDLG